MLHPQVVNLCCTRETQAQCVGLIALDLLYTHFSSLESRSISYPTNVESWFPALCCVCVCVCVWFLSFVIPSLVLLVRQDTSTPCEVANTAVQAIAMVGLQVRQIDLRIKLSGASNLVVQ